MSTLFDRLTRQFDQSHHIGPLGLRDDSAFAPRERRPAAVLIAVTDRAEPGILLTCRPETMPSHPGQIAFPGGKLEPGEDAVAAALREAEEELGIDPASVRVIGEAASFITGSGFHLTPVLAMVPPDIAIRPDPREVADWFEAPLRHVLDFANHVPRVGLFGPEEEVQVERSYTEILWDKYRIWGITAGIIVNMAHRLTWRELVD